MSDWIIGTDLADLIFGNNGDDLLAGEKGNDVILGGAGDDYISGGRGHDTLLGGDGSDEVRGGHGNDSVSGEDGNDEIYGGNGDDTVDGGAGDDLIWAGNGNDVMIGGVGNDTFFGSAGGDLIMGGDGFDDSVDYSLSASAVHVNLTTHYGQYGDAAGDSYSGIEHVIGSDFGDVLVGDENENHLTGGLGDDILHAGAASGELGVDVLDGGSGNDRMYGNADKQLFVVGPGDDSISGGGGDDILDFRTSGAPAGWIIDMEDGHATQSYFTAGGTYLDNSVSFDAMFMVLGTIHDDIVWGDAADNLIAGQEGSDYLFGGGGNDTIVASAGGHDVMHGGSGDDLLSVSEAASAPAEADGWAELSGGTGADEFAFAFLDAAPHMDCALIIDFDRTEGDRIAIRGYGSEGMTFIGDAEFVGGNITEVRAEALNKSGTDFLVEVDSDGNGFAEFSFEVTVEDGLGALTAADFVFG